MDQATWLFLVALITRLKQIFRCLIFIGQATFKNTSPTKISLSTLRRHTMIDVSYLFVRTCTCMLFMGRLLFHARLALVSFSAAVDHATTIWIKKSFTSIASMLSGFSFYSIVVRPRSIFGNIPSV